MNWLSRNASAIQALAAITTATVAVAALIGVKYQLDAADALQRAQSAREAYRSHLALSTSHPEYTSPADACELLHGSTSGAYTAFVDHLLYSAEQMLEVEPGWETTFSDELIPHAAYICSADDRRGSTARMKDLLSQFRGSVCAGTKYCK